MKNFFHITAAILCIAVAGCGPHDPQARVNAGAEALARGDITKAMMLLENVPITLPRDSRAQNLYGEALYLFGKPEEAAKAFERALKADPNNPAPRYNLGLAAFATRDYATAVEQFQTSVSLDSRNVSSWLFLGATYLSLGNLDAAYRATRNVLDLDPRNPDALNNLAVIAERRNQPRYAEAWLKQALQASPNYPPACLNLGRVYELELKDKPHALEAYRRYMSLVPESSYRFAVTRSIRQLELDLNLPPSTTTTPPPAPVTNVVQATQTQLTTPPPPPLKAPEPVASTVPSTNINTLSQPQDLQAASLRLQVQQLVNERRLKDAADASVMLADIYAQQKDFSRAAEAFARAVELDPLNPMAHYRLAEFLQQQAQKPAALQSFQEAVRLKPDFLAAIRRSAALAIELGNADVALAALNRLIEMVPDEPGAYLQLAELQDRQLKQKAAADQTYQLFLKKFPNAPESKQVRLRFAPKTPPAKPASKPAPAKPKEPTPESTNTTVLVTPPAAVPKPAPIDVTATYRSALSLLQQGKWPQAEQQFKAIVQADPGFAQAHLGLGQIYSNRLETKQQAREHYKRFLELRPNDPKANDVRRWLEIAR